MMLLLVAAWVEPAVAALREPVHPRRNVETFAPVDAKFVRFTVRATNRGEPCLDELEIYERMAGLPTKSSAPWFVPTTMAKVISCSASSD